MRNNPITQLLGIEYPIIQGGMAWTSGHKLAAAVSNEGGLGILGAGTMYPDQLREEIRNTRKLSDKPFGVNLPLVYPSIDEHIAIIIEENVPIVITSAGNPATWTSHLKEHGIKVLHVVSSSKFAKKAEECGVDAIIAEGFEAGGHNGREETTTMCLIPAVRDAISIPLVAAGGIASGRSMVAALALGADGVQIGTAFALTEESTCHPAFKEHCINLGEGDTKLMLKKLMPTRLAKGGFTTRVAEAEANGATKEELAELLGRGRAKKGMYEGDLEEGELEIGQISATIDRIRSVREVMGNILREAREALRDLGKISL
ncbi:MAG: nitronate monooxygenase [Bacteroidales bacterium]|uniref:NAD(P)H-dependent flavin oxidoreductase n=1 Tax=Porphyromonas sp. TaxID=1924944 RepID=UPI0029794749|nr:nitronate monooxygenase [Porphyromonas sp.]MDD7437565.1 nitronate monooxygenase [Bacteroidales bacterium]MDY3067254.1 nitronate monooxygenase [Porphyromonas sp.]